MSNKKLPRIEGDPEGCEPVPFTGCQNCYLHGKSECMHAPCSSSDCMERGHIQYKMAAWPLQTNLLRSSNERLRSALQKFVDYYEQAGISGDEVDDSADVQFDGDEKANVRAARKVLAETEPKKEVE